MSVASSPYANLALRLGLSYQDDTLSSYAVALSLKFPSRHQSNLSFICIVSTNNPLYNPLYKEKALYT